MLEPYEWKRSRTVLRREGASNRPDLVDYAPLVRRLGGQDIEVEASLAAAARKPSVGRLLDIGTGTGRVLELLSAEAESATGIDRSPEMLRLARGKLAGGGMKGLMRGMKGMMGARGGMPPFR